MRQYHWQWWTVLNIPEIKEPLSAYNVTVLQWGLSAPLQKYSEHGSNSVVGLYRCTLQVVEKTKRPASFKVIQRKVNFRNFSNSTQRGAFSWRRLDF